MNIVQIAELVPKIVDLVKKAEEVFGPGNGQTKLNFVLGLLTTAAEQIPGLDTKNLASVVTAVVRFVVAALNAAGIFKSATTSTPVAA